MTHHYVCVFTLTTYGISGNELSPPVKSKETYACLSLPGELPAQFAARMQTEGMGIRARQAAAPVKAYSQPDTCDWFICPVKP